MNRPHNDQNDLVMQWIDKAEHDYHAALYLLESAEHEVPYDVVCFHSQQCVEKYMKAAGVNEGMVIPRTHDLLELLDLLPPSVRQSILANECAELNPYGIDIRYPGFMEGPAREDAARALSIANRVRTVCRVFLLKKPV